MIYTIIAWRILLLRRDEQAMKREGRREGEIVCETVWVFFEKSRLTGTECVGSASGICIFCCLTNKKHHIAGCLAATGRGFKCMSYSQTLLLTPSNATSCTAKRYFLCSRLCCLGWCVSVNHWAASCYVKGEIPAIFRCDAAAGILQVILVR